MAISIHIEPTSGMAVVTCRGVLGVSDAQEAASALWQAPGWAGEAAVWDFRESRFDLSSSEIRQLASFILKNQPATPPLRVVFVAPRDVDFGLARMFEVFRKDERTAFKVTRKYEEAVAWARSGRDGAA